MVRSLGASLGVMLAVLVAPGSGRAQDFPPIEDRDFAIDHYRGPVLGSPRIVGMGGAAVATAEGSAHTSANPAAPAVRPTTSTGKYGWDLHIDALSGGAGTDIDNNGIARDDALGYRPVATAGLLGQYRAWALAIDVASEASAQLTAGDSELFAETGAFQISLARSFRDRELTAGLGLRQVYFDMTRDRVDSAPEDLFVVSGTVVHGGAVWSPPMSDVRVGASLALPLLASEVDVVGCPPTDCEGYVLPERVDVAWRAAAGVAWRWGDDRWNQTIDAHYRDESYVLVAADAVVTGAVRDGHGLEAFARGQLQPSGRRPNVSVRGGAEHEWIPGRLRIRGGTYWEPARFLDPDGAAVPGRLHLTLGADLRIVQFHLWSTPYRLRVSLTSDVARHYGNGGFSIGFWK